MSMFANGEEVICIDTSNGADAILKKGKTYIVLGQGAYCKCCIDVGVGWFCFETRFRRPIHEVHHLVNKDLKVVETWPSYTSSHIRFAGNLHLMWPYG